MIRLFIFILFSVFITSTSSAQSAWYVTSGGETIFSWNSFINSPNDGAVIRFAPVINIQSMVNKDMGKSFGIYSGFALRNVGFIADDPANADTRRKFRTYNVALPLGIKIGNMKGKVLYAGGDLEYAFHFKEKKFVNGDKIERVSYWFSDRIRKFQPSVHVGLQFWSGTNVKFKYYPRSFFNPDRTDIYDSLYKRFDSNVFYISLNSNLFKGKKFTYTETE